MLVNNEKNKMHWEKLGANYSRVWEGHGKKRMNEREMGFIKKHLNKKNANFILDIGVGNGRILEKLVKCSNSKSQIFGLDISPEMISICKEKFEKEDKIVALSTCDIAKKQIIFKTKFDYITAIRVLKYNKNWKEIVGKIYQKLNTNGIFVFTMLNSNSINRFFKYPIPLYRTNINELTETLKKNNFEIIEIRSFTKLPDYFYNNSNSVLLAKIVIVFENILEYIFGKIFLGRILFIAVRKND